MHNPRFSDLHDIPPRAFSPTALALQVSPWLLVGLGAWGGLPLWICLFCGVCLSLGLLPALATATHWRALMQPHSSANPPAAWIAPLAADLAAQHEQRLALLARLHQQLAVQTDTQQQQRQALREQLEQQVHGAQQYLPPAYISTGTMLGSYSAISTSVPVGGRWQTIVDARVECELFDPDTGKSVWFGGADVRAPSHMIHTSIAREAASGLAKEKLVKMGRPFGKEQR